MVLIAYLAAIVAANVSVSYFGPAVAPLNAFLFIGLDLTLRDRLHDRLSFYQMAALILVGASISYWLASPAVAVASGVAFFAATLADTLVYAALGRHARVLRVNGSNVVGAAVDSVLFPTLAFGVLLPWVIVAQFAAKVAGGFVWYVLLRRTPTFSATHS